MDGRIKNMLKRYNDNFNKLVEEDAEARKQKTLVGRYIAEPFADGRAYYKDATAHRYQKDEVYYGCYIVWSELKKWIKA